MPDLIRDRIIKILQSNSFTGIKLFKMITSHKTHCQNCSNGINTNRKTKSGACCESHTYSHHIFPRPIAKYAHRQSSISVSLDLSLDIRHLLRSEARVPRPSPSPDRPERPSDAAPSPHNIYLYPWNSINPIPLQNRKLTITELSPRIRRVI